MEGPLLQEWKGDNMIIASNPQKQMEYIDEDLDGMIEQINDLKEIFGDREEIEKVIKCISQFKNKYKNWNRINMWPMRDKCIKNEESDE